MFTVLIVVSCRQVLRMLSLNLSLDFMMVCSSCPWAEIWHGQSWRSSPLTRGYSVPRLRNTTAQGWLYTLAQCPPVIGCSDAAAADHIRRFWRLTFSHVFTVDFEIWLTSCLSSSLKHCEVWGTSAFCTTGLATEVDGASVHATCTLYFLPFVFEFRHLWVFHL